MYFERSWIAIDDDHLPYKFERIGSALVAVFNNYSTLQKFSQF